MNRTTGTASAGREADASTPSVAQDPTQLASGAPQITWPEWGPASMPAPWWEAVTYPCAPLAQRREAAESGPGTSAYQAATMIRTDNWGFFRSRKGGGLKMARIAAILTALASLFLVAGAAAKY